MFSLYKYKVYQQHIADCSDRYAKQGVAFPNVHNRRHRNTYQLRNYVVYITVFKIFEAINNQYSEYRYRQNIAEVFYEFRHLFFAAEKRKGEKARRECANSRNYYH